MIDEKKKRLDKDKMKCNKPQRAAAGKKQKKTVKACKDGKEKIIHYGFRGMEDFTQHKDPKRRKSFRARHKCKTAKDKLTARYWACKDLWENSISEDNHHHPDYEADGKRGEDLDRCIKLYKDGKTKEAAACRQKMEKPHMKESMLISKDALNILINDSIEEGKLDAILEQLVDRVDEKKRKKKSSKSKKGLSKSVKKSLDKKADKRCLTRGSVYAEFRKGLAAFLSSGSRKGMTAHQWAHARVNSAQPSKSWAVVKKRKKCPKKKKK